MQEIKKGWKKFQLGDIAKITSSKRVYLKDYVENGVPFFRGKEFIKIFNNQANNDILYIAEEKYLEIKNKFGVPQEGDILLTSVGTLGIPYLVKKGDKFYFKDGNLIWFRNIDSGVNSKFFYYWIISSKGASALKSITIGSSQQAFTIVGIKTLEILLPPISTQQKIASVLSKYDDLIENNNKRIKNLEETAQAIYKEWFVNYNFPGSENVKMVDSGNDDFGMIPEGWEIKSILDYIDFIRGVEPGSKNYKEEKGDNDINFIRVGDLGNRNSGIYINNKLTKGKIVDKKNVLVTFDGTVGIVRRGFSGCYSTGIRKIIGKTGLLSNEYLYLFFKSENIQNKIKEHAKGTTILHAGESIKYMKIILASDIIYKEFNKIVFPILEEVLNIEAQNQNLKETRDLLIPRLVSGELDVEDLDVK